MKAVKKFRGVELSRVHLDALQEISNIGMGHAATALNQMIGKPVHLSIPEASLVSLAEVPEVLGGTEAMVAGIYLKIWGDIQGNILLVLPEKSTVALCMLLTGEPPGENLLLSEMHASALREIGNIVASSYLAALEKLLGKTLIPSVPSIAVDMAGAVVDYILIQLGEGEDEEEDNTIIIKASFTGGHNFIHGHFYLLPDPGSLKIILQAAKVLAEDQDQG